VNANDAAKRGKSITLRDGIILLWAILSINFVLHNPAAILYSVAREKKKNNNKTR